MKENKNESKTGSVFELTSSAFENNTNIPRKYSCDGENVSPALKWTSPGVDVKSFAMIMDDPDAPNGDFVHWVIYNIPSSVTDLPENFSSENSGDIDYTQGISSFGKTYYKGPCPPPGTHRYFFKLYALDEMPDVKPGLSKKELLDAVNGHILSQTQLMGKYSK